MRKDSAWRAVNFKALGVSSPAGLLDPCKNLLSLLADEVCLEIRLCSPCFRLNPSQTELPPVSPSVALKSFARG